MRDIFPNFWDNWNEMSAVERVARILANKEAPEALIRLIKVWIDENYEDYLSMAKIIVAEVERK